MEEDARLDSLTRAHEELEELLRQEFQDVHLQRTLGQGSDEAQPDILSTRQHYSAMYKGGDREGSALQSEPSLLGSGWSWQTPKDAKEGMDFLLNSHYMNDTAENRGLMLGISRHSSEPKIENELQSHSMRSLGLSPTIHEVLQERQNSVFSASVSSSEDNWSLSDEGDAIVKSQELGRIIGRGAFGTVYEAVWKGEPVAIKVIEHEDEFGFGDACSDMSDRDLMRSNQDHYNPEGASAPHLRDPVITSQCISIKSTQADQAILEAAMSSAVHHPNIVNTYHYQTLEADEGRAMRETRIVMELCNGGSLEKAVSDGRLSVTSGNDIDLQMLCLSLLEVASAMDYLHSMQITHRDLKLGNALLKTQPVTERDRRGFTVKVSDFGLSRLLPDISPKAGQDQEYTGTITHMAPELLENGGMSRAADVYSYGILMWEALMGETAYDGISKMQVMFGVVSEGLRPLFPENTPRWYSQIATACWREHPKQRPTFLRIKQKLQRQMIDLME